MKHILAAAFIIFQINLGFSQTNAGKVSGIILNENKAAVEFANITLHRVTDSVFVKAAITDEKGNFELDDLSDGNYYFKVSHASFQNFRSDNFTISPEKQTLNFSNVILKSNSNNLKEVVVTKEKQFIERKLDKIVVNVENSIVSAGSTALDVLERSPGVMVNQESSINLKGKSGVVVMIDGKPTPLSGTDLIVYLKSVPAANIQTIEIITNPSAKYDAEGNAGIINIKFKKDQKQGFNGSATLSYGQGVYAKPSGSINLNFREKKWNFFGSHSYANPLNYGAFFINRKFFDSNHNVTSIFEQNSFTKVPSISNNSRVGADFYANEKTVFGVMMNGNWNNNDRYAKTDAVITHPDGTLDYTTKTNILSDEARFNGFANFNFKHSFNTSGKEITADIDYGKFDAETLQYIHNINANPDGSVISDDKIDTNQTGTITVKSIKTDYVHPFTDKMKLEAGLKSSLVTSDNDVKFYDIEDGNPVLDVTKSNHFIYDENINAAYGSFSKELTKWDFQAGLRMEHTNTHGKQLATGEHFSRNYIDLFPNIVVNRKFSENNSLSFSYTKRIDRPTYRQLNPFRIFVDSYTYVVGDPTLNSVITHSFELNHTFKGKYITTLSYTRSKESITDIFVQDDATQISYQIPANIQDYEQYNLGIYIPFKYKKIINSTLSASVYLNKYSSPLQGGSLQQDFTSWDMNLGNNISIGKGWSAELSGYYQSRMVWGLFYIKHLSQISAGIQKVSNDKNSIFKLSVSDIFLTNHIAVDVRYQNQDFFTERTWDSRVVTLSYTYRFGKNTVSKARQRTTGVEDEKRRAG
ncbi:MAG TPA: TonB-dependent receptor [Flavobacterium sp.]|uniref:TonB-dependent receptor n=1 Tax=Flavobacterium sp. TaxID=239 RepID=UPI002CDBD42E|nr:TonB-dependent receptor [Flavobacterium sp.]HNP32114.1 TonB-dependent receptor [Flavobacterium sp.]